MFWGDRMKKVSGWLVAIVTSAVSLAAMLLFDLLLSWVYFYLGKVAFLVDILDFIGELLDLGLTALVAVLIVGNIWTFGHSLIDKINGEEIPYNKTPLYHTNNVFIFLFLAMVMFVGYQFFTEIGGAVDAYTAGMQGVGKILMFLKAIKDVFLYVRSEYIYIYKIGANSLILTAISLIMPDK